MTTSNRAAGNVRRCLVTTSHRDFWNTEGPLLLLGQWCANGRDAAQLAGRDVHIAAPYGFALEQRDADHAAVRALEERLFPDLCRMLNAAHGVSHTERYWQILTGQWFRTALSVLFNRVRTLQACLEAHGPACTLDPGSAAFVLARPASNEALWAYSDPRWDGHCCLRILKLIAPQLAFEERPAAPERAAPAPAAIPGPGTKKKLLVSAWRVLQQVAQRFARSTDAFIINSYLPRDHEVRLQLRLGQFPQLWKSPAIRFDQRVDRARRQQYAAQWASSNNDTVEQVARALLFEIIPVCYLEGYQHLVSSAARLPWPDSPKFIFTSNNFGTDELFKAWAAERVQRGVRYIVGQHGNNYGTHRYVNPSVEEATSDAFVTWGWKGKLSQHTPGFNLKVPAGTELRADPQGGVLLVQVWAGHRIVTWDSSEQFLHYLADQFAFVKGLAQPAKALLKVRLHHDWARLDWNEPERWKQFDPLLRLDPGFEGIQDQIRKSRLVIHSYDSTGLLETLALDIPTLAFWQNGLAHLRDEVQDDFQALVDAGIVHLSPASAAATVNAICDDVAGWWREPARREAVRKFCSKYSRLSADPARDLAALLNRAAAAELNNH
ncbi:LIC12162 family protein [Massilia solisilvae]|uniref:LIC12162 family protein n=1 Tax=Massilia solisilvae TaxID=1811225 RepID=A0ABT2BG14_9BURK|nr:LIC12162 family protein [Massilia solisilvae]MCS0606990.1 LIC12162 family protein [Massilia solisilvae]